MTLGVSRVARSRCTNVEESGARVGDDADRH